MQARTRRLALGRPSRYHARMLRSSFATLLARAFAATLAAFAPGAAADAGARTVAVLEAGVDHIDLWPALRAASGADAPSSLEQAIGQPWRFKAPGTARGAMGFVDGPVWLRIAVVVPGPHAVRRVLGVDYALLNRIEAAVVQGGRVSARAAMGNKVPWAERPLRGRQHAAELEFPPGASELLLRVESRGSKILPIALSTWERHHRHELVETLLQGLFVSLGVWLLFFSLLQWRILQEQLYVKYALLIVASTLYSVHFFGIGEQYLWTDQHWLENHLAGLTALLAACGTALFVEDALRRDMPRGLARALKGLAAFLCLAALAHALDLIGIREVGTIMGSVGLLPVVLGMPGAVRRIRRGDATGALFMVAWLGYLIGSAIKVGVVKGTVGADFWTLHSFQLASIFDMLIFMQIAVIGTRRLKAELAAEQRRFVERQKQELEIKVAERTSELASERQRSDALLLHILPPAIAEELKTTGRCVPKRHEEVSVVFTDLVDFTRTVAAIPAAKAVAELNDIFTAFDGIVAEFGLEKINTVGDAYMAAAGVPHAVADHATRAVHAALAMQAYIAHRNRHADVKWGLRAGIHSGPVVAGVVGSTKYAYGIWGDTVNVASRMESHSEPGRVNVSAATRALIKGAYRTCYRGKLSAKGKGEIDMYFVIDETVAANEQATDAGVTTASAT
jgi:class 3 adenylate cyclase